MISVSVALADDVVHLRSDQGANGRATLRGEILDYTGEAITIRRLPAAPRRYAADRVLGFETTWNPAYQAAKDALARHDFEAAVRHLGDANRSEQRTWVRRLILAELMRTHDATGQPEQAGDIFLAVVASDPTTPAVSDAPLPWFPDDRVSRAKAESWLRSPDRPAARLLGASWLSMSTDGAAAIAALNELTDNKDPRIAALAEAQLWRSKLMRATAADAADWAERIERMPAVVRAGPYFTLAQLYDRLEMTDEAALAYLRIPILFPARGELDARALIAAARTVRRTGHAEEATRLLTEVINQYGKTRPAAEARQLLENPSVPTNR